MDDSTSRTQMKPSNQYRKTSAISAYYWKKDKWHPPFTIILGTSSLGYSLGWIFCLLFCLISLERGFPPLTLKLSLFALLETYSRKLFPKLTILVIREALTERNSRSVITSTLTLGYNYSRGWLFSSSLGILDWILYSREGNFQILLFLKQERTQS